MNRSYIYLGPLFLLLMSLATVARAGMFDFMRVYLFSEIGGVVTMDGKPVSGVKVVRITEADKNYKDKTVTDAQGRFHFKARIEYSLYKSMFEQAVIFQEIKFLYKGKEYLGWEHGKNNYENDGETYNKTPLTHLRCELSSKPTKKDDDYGPISGICNWK